jgi:anti-sigma B factor antagonist
MSDGFEPPGPSSDLLSVTPVDVGSISIIHAAGEIDMSTAPQLRAVLVDRIAAVGATAVLLDMEGVTFVGSAGVEVLITAADHSTVNGVRFGVVAADDHRVARLLQIAGIDHLRTHTGVMAALSDPLLNTASPTPTASTEAATPQGPSLVDEFPQNFTKRAPPAPSTGPREGRPNGGGPT